MNGCLLCRRGWKFFFVEIAKKAFSIVFFPRCLEHIFRSNPPQREESTAREHREVIIITVLVITTALRIVSCSSKSLPGSANVETSVFPVENYFTRSPAIATHVETRTKNKGKVSRRRF